MTRPAPLYAAVMAGSSLGAIARFACSLAMVSLFGPGFPWGTLAVNVLGSFLIGLYATITEPDGCLRVSPAMRQFVIAGFCGGFTTFSIFSLETVLLIEDGRLALGAANLIISLVCWFGAVWLGYRLGEKLNGRQRL